MKLLEIICYMKTQLIGTNYKELVPINLTRLLFDH